MVLEGRVVSVLLSISPRDTALLFYRAFSDSKNTFVSCVAPFRGLGLVCGIWQALLLPIRCLVWMRILGMHLLFCMGTAVTQNLLISPPFLSVVPSAQKVFVTKSMVERFAPEPSHKTEHTQTVQCTKASAARRSVCATMRRLVSIPAPRQWTASYCTVKL